MSKSPNWGGRRKGSGRKKITFNFKSIGDSFTIERAPVNEVPGPPEVWEIALVSDDYFELQRTVNGTSEIMTISKLSFWNGD